MAREYPFLIDMPSLVLKQTEGAFFVEMVPISKKQNFLKILLKKEKIKPMSVQGFVMYKKII